MRYSLTLLAIVMVACDDPVEPNESPIVTMEIPDQIVPWDTGLDIHLVPHFRDPDGTEITYSATSLEPEIIEVTVEDSYLVLEAKATEMTQTTITVIAEDPDGGVVSTTFLANGNIAYRDDFDRASVLAAWEVIPDTEVNPFLNPDPPFAKVEDGKLHLYPYSYTINRLGLSVRHNLNTPISGNWVISAGISVTSRNPNASLCVDVIALTGDDYYEAYSLRFDYSQNNWTMWAAAEIDDPYWHPYWFQMGKLFKWKYLSKEETTDVSFSLIEGATEVTSGGNTVGRFDVTNLSVLDEPSRLIWPPDEFPPELVAIEIENSPNCGPYAPNRGMDPEDRNILSIDWIQVTQELIR